MTTEADRTANPVEAIFLETCSPRYVLIDCVRGYVLRNVTMESGVKVRNRSGVLQI